MADVCAAAVVVCDLDAAGTSALCHSLLSFHSVVWFSSLLPAVCVGHGPRKGTAPARWHHEPAPAGFGPSTVPLFAFRSHGEDSEALAKNIFMTAIIV